MAELEKPVEQDAAAKRRARQTLINLLLSLAATAGLVVAVVLAVPRVNENLVQPVDYKAIASQVAASTSKPIIVPNGAALGKGWWCNSARWTAKTTDGVDNWYVGFVGPDGQYIGLTQAFNSNPTWDGLFLNAADQAGHLNIDGIPFEVLKSAEAHDPPKSKDYALLTHAGADSIFVYGTASRQDLQKFAKLVVDQRLKVYP